MSRVGVVVALASEARALTLQRLAPGEITELVPGVLVVLCGMGPLAASRAATQLAESGVNALAVFGVAGALSQQLRPGDLLCPSTVLSESGGRYATDAAWRARIAVPADATLLSVGAVLADADAKLAAHRRSGAHAVDMESAAVAEVARSRHLPLLAVRAIADAAGDTIPDGVAGAVDAYGRPRILAMAGALLRNPSAIPALPRLATRMNRALDALSALVARTGPALGWN